MPLPQGVAGPDQQNLVLQINDRLRRIDDLIASLQTAQPAKPSTGGGGGAGGGVTAVTGTFPIASTGGTTPDISIATATASALGAVQPDGTSITITTGGIIHAPGGGRPFAEPLAGVQDNVNRVFTVPSHTPLAGSAHVYRNGVEQDYPSGTGQDWVTISGNVVTFLVVPHPDDELWVEYLY